MGKRLNKFIEKLIASSGGWEKLLYQTLKDICEEIRVSQKDFEGRPGENAIEEAEEVLAAYEEAIGKPIQRLGSQVQPVVEGSSRVVEAHKPASLESRVDRKAKLPEPVYHPRHCTASVNVDDTIGASQGDLPVSLGFELIDRENIIVRTRGGIELGRGSSDGQVRGKGASGHISLSGKYRLVFTDTSLGVGLVEYYIIKKSEEPKLPTPPPVENISEAGLTKPEEVHIDEELAGGSEDC